MSGLQPSVAQDVNLTQLVTGLEEMVGKIHGRLFDLPPQNAAKTATPQAANRVIQINDRLAQVINALVEIDSGLGAL